MTRTIDAIDRDLLGLRGEVAFLQSALGTYGQTLPWNMPRGLIASVQRTTSQTGISTIADVTSMSVTFTAVANRNYRLSAVAYVTNGSVANAQTEVDITTSGNTRVALGSVVLSATGVVPVVTTTPACLLTLSAGSVTFKLRAQVTSGTVDLLGAATAPMILSVEDLGPSARPS